MKLKENRFTNQYAAVEALDKIKYVMAKTNWGFARDVRQNSNGDGTFFIEYLSSDGWHRLSAENLTKALEF